MKRYLPFIIVIGVALLTVGSGAYFYRTKHAASPPLTISKTETEKSGEVVHVLGPADAVVTLEEFGDFQCPPCGRLSEPINQLQKQYNLRVIYREFPLAIHAHAKEAAYAGDKMRRRLAAPDEATSPEPGPGYLRRTYVAVPRGRESDHLDVDAAVNRLLAGR